MGLLQWLLLGSLDMAAQCDIEHYEPLSIMSQWKNGVLPQGCTIERKSNPRRSYEHFA
jgi:hypothetical protein